MEPKGKLDGHDLFSQEARDSQQLPRYADDGFPIFLLFSRAHSPDYRRILSD